MTNPNWPFTEGNDVWPFTEEPSWPFDSSPVVVGGLTPAAGGGGGGGDYTNITFTGVLDPANDVANMMTQPTGSTPINPLTDGTYVRRWNPSPTWPAGAYINDNVDPTPTWRTPANGINGIAVIDMVSSARLRMWLGDGFTSAALYNAGSMVFGWCGEQTGTREGTDWILYNNNATGDEFAVQSQADGTYILYLRMASSQTKTITITPDGNALFSVVVWFHDGAIDYWLNGVKQTQIESVNNFSSLTGASWNLTLQNNVSLKLMHMAFAASHDNEADVANLAARYETLLGR